VASTQAVAGDCAPSCTVEGQWKGPIHCNRDPQHHEDWESTSLWPTIGDPRLDIVKSEDASSKWDTLINARTRSDFDHLATQLKPREMIINGPSIEAHKNLVYGQARMNDILPYEDVNTGSNRDIRTDRMIASTVPPSVSSVGLGWVRLTTSEGWVIMFTLMGRVHASG